YHDRVFIFAELKLRDTPVKEGQRKAFQRVVDRIASTGAVAVFVIAEHEIDEPKEDVPSDRCRVREMYRDGAWHPPTREWTLRQLCDWLIGYVRPREAPDKPRTVTAPTADEIFGKTG